MKKLCTILVFLFAASCNATDNCAQWFKKSKVPLGPDCLTKCTSLSTDLSTFTCPRQCASLCDERSLLEKLLGNLAYYPGLTTREKQLIIQHPTEAIKVFVQKEKAENSTYETFGRDAQDDESDAYRHFVWAGLLSKELGPDLAKEFLDAHEYGHMSDPSSAMDLANNRAG